MTATVGGIHLGIDTHANRPAGNSCPDGSLYSCSTHGLVYRSNYAGNSWATWATLGGGGGVIVQDEGGALSTTADTLNFVGAGVTASGTGTTKTITIAGGGGGGGTPADAAASLIAAYSLFR